MMPFPTPDITYENQLRPQFFDMKQLTPPDTSTYFILSTVPGMCYASARMAGGREEGSFVQDALRWVCKSVGTLVPSHDHATKPRQSRDRRRGDATLVLEVTLRTRRVLTDRTLLNLASMMRPQSVEIRSWCIEYHSHLSGVSPQAHHVETYFAFAQQRHCQIGA